MNCLLSYGNEKIWDMLAEKPEKPRRRIREQPEMLRFPCSTQSYTDIEGSGGNFNLSSARRHWQSSLHSREWIISISEADT